MSTTFRVLIGRNIMDKSSGARCDTEHPTWAEARDDLACQIHREYPATLDACMHCLGQAQDALLALVLAPEGQPFEAGIDGCDYLIVPGSKQETRT